jgi:hypothetical protein
MFDFDNDGDVFPCCVCGKLIQAEDAFSVCYVCASNERDRQNQIDFLSEDMVVGGF